MTASAQEADRSAREDRKKRVLSLLDEALQIIDETGDHPEIGARLAHVIESVKQMTERLQD